MISSRKRCRSSQQVYAQNRWSLQTRIFLSQRSRRENNLLIDDWLTVLDSDTLACFKVTPSKFFTGFEPTIWVCSRLNCIFAEKFTALSPPFQSSLSWLPLTFNSLLPKVSIVVSLSQSHQLGVLLGPSYMFSTALISQSSRAKKKKSSLDASSAARGENWMRTQK